MQRTRVESRVGRKQKLRASRQLPNVNGAAAWLEWVREGEVSFSRRPFNYSCRYYLFTTVHSALGTSPRYDRVGSRCKARRRGEEEEEEGGTLRGARA